MVLKEEEFDKRCCSGCSKECGKNLRRWCSLCNMNEGTEENDVELMVAPHRRRGQGAQNLGGNDPSAPPMEEEAEGFSPISGRT